MRKLNPYPIWWRISDATRVALARFQMDKYSCELEIPDYPLNFVINPIILTTEQAGRLMRKTRRHFK